MKKAILFSGALTLCAAAALALLIGCDNSSKKIIPTPTITPKFLYASSCADDSQSAFARFRGRKIARKVQSKEVSGAVDGYSVDATTGALTPLADGAVATGLECPEFLTTDPGQKFLFVPDEEDDVIHAYTIGSTGTLTEVSGSPYDVGCVFQVAVDPTGKFLVAPDYCNSDVDVFSIGSTGALTPVTGSPFAVSSGFRPESVFIDPNGQWVYVSEVTDGPSVIGGFSLSSAGAMAEILGSPFAAGSFSYTIAGTPDGKHIYTTDRASGADDILAYSVNTTTGALTPLATPSYPGGSCWLSVDTTGSILFSTDCDGNVFSSVIGSDGSLTTATGSPATAGTDTWPVIGDPSGKFVYAADDSDTGQIFAYTYSSAGVLTAVSSSPYPSGIFIEGIVVTH